MSSGYVYNIKNTHLFPSKSLLNNFSLWCNVRPTRNA